MDIVAAFPGRLYAWLWEVLARWGIHGPMFAMLRACCHLPIALLEHGGV